MSNGTMKSVPLSFWVISAVMLIWNVLGSINFFMQMDPRVLAGYMQSEQAIVSSRPLWGTIAFGAAVFGGTLGCLLLLLRKSAAYYVLILSFAGVVGTMIHTVSLAVSSVDFSPMEIFGVMILPLLVAGFLIWYAKQAMKKGWIS